MLKPIPSRRCVVRASIIVTTLACHHRIKAGRDVKYATECDENMPLGSRIYFRVSFTHGIFPTKTYNKNKMTYLPDRSSCNGTWPSEVRRNCTSLGTGSPTAQRPVGPGSRFWSLSLCGSSPPGTTACDCCVARTRLPCMHRVAVVANAQARRRGNDCTRTRPRFWRSSTCPTAIQAGGCRGQLAKIKQDKSNNKQQRRVNKE